MKIRPNLRIIYISIIIILIVTTIAALYDGGYHISGGVIAGIALTSIITSLLPFIISMRLLKKYESNGGERSKFKKVTTNKVSRGCIVVFGNTHTEIITSIKKYKFADDGFCSIGAGRGNRSSTGTIRCDGSMNPDETREIENPNNTYYTL